MAVLPDVDRKRLWCGLMRHWSTVWEIVPISKNELRDAINATDAWIENNQASFNAALPAPARTRLLPEQKTLIFCVVSLARASMAFLRQIFGEVD